MTALGAVAKLSPIRSTDALVGTMSCFAVIASLNRAELIENTSPCVRFDLPALISRLHRRRGQNRAALTVLWGGTYRAIAG